MLRWVLLKEILFKVTFPCAGPRAASNHREFKEKRFPLCTKTFARGKISMKWGILGGNRDIWSSASPWGPARSCSGAGIVITFWTFQENIHVFWRGKSAMRDDGWLEGLIAPLMLQNPLVTPDADGHRLKNNPCAFWHHPVKLRGGSSPHQEPLSIKL